jgi:hypothetical protein
MIVGGDDVQPPWLHGAEMVRDVVLELKEKKNNNKSEIIISDISDTEQIDPDEAGRGDFGVARTCEGCSDDSFLKSFESEVERISIFYNKTLTEIKSQMNLSLEKINEKGVVSGFEVNKRLKKSIRKEKKNRELSVIQEYVALYRKLEKLESYACLNVLLCIKILKKHDKMKLDAGLLEVPLYPNLMNDLVYQVSFGKTATKEDEITIVRNRLIELYAEFCCDGDIIEARGKLRMHKGEHNEINLYTLGLKLGGLFVFLIWFIWDCLVDPGEGRTLWNDPAIYLYSFLGNLLMYDWLWGINVYIWEQANINYLVLLDLTVQHAPSHLQIFSHTADFSYIYLINLLLYYKARRNDLHYNIPPHYFPIALVLLGMSYFVVNMFLQRHHVSHRLYSPQVLYRIITSPFSNVTLREIYTADVMTSFIKVFSNFIYASCYLASSSYAKESTTIHHFGTCQHSYMTYISGLFALLPLWFRFAQCLRRIYETSINDNSPVKFIIWPHSYNALKYLLSVLVVILSLSHPLSDMKSVNKNSRESYRIGFILLCLVTTIYQFYWDVCNDWGFFKVRPRRDDLFRSDSYLFLRNKLMYKSNIWLYYVLILLNLVLRGLWTLSLIPQGSSGGPFSYSLSDQLGPFLAAFELCRRSIWGCYRLEWEHINASDSDGGGQSIPYHVEKKEVVAAADPNKDFKVVLYHLILGGLCVAAVAVIIVQL